MLDAVARLCHWHHREIGVFPRFFDGEQTGRYAILHYFVEKASGSTLIMNTTRATSRSVKNSERDIVNAHFHSF